LECDLLSGFDDVRIEDGAVIERPYFRPVQRVAKKIFRYAPEGIAFFNRKILGGLLSGDLTPLIVGYLSDLTPG
jgi:hypothetical protein